MEFITIANEIERLSYHLTYSKDTDFFYDCNDRPMLYKEQWNEVTEILKELTPKEQDLFYDLLAHLCPNVHKEVKFTWENKYSI